MTFQEERPVFLREYASKLYTVGAYYSAKIFAEIPVLSITPMIFAVIVYFKIGLAITAVQFFYFYLVLLLVTHVAASVGYLLSSFFPDSDTAIQVTAVVLFPFILFGGQFVNAGSIKAWIGWVQYVDPIRYGFEALVRNEFDQRNYNSTMII